VAGGEYQSLNLTPFVPEWLSASTMCFTDHRQLVSVRLSKLSLKCSCCEELVCGRYQIDIAAVGVEGRVVCMYDESGPQCTGEGAGELCSEYIQKGEVSCGLRKDGIGAVGHICRMDHSRLRMTDKILQDLRVLQLK